MKQKNNGGSELAGQGPGGLTGWLLRRLRRGNNGSGPRLALLERIALTPKQSLALVEAEGRRFLVATPAEGSPVFYALDERARPAGREYGSSRPAAVRVSW